MTDESNTGAPRGPLFVALDLADRIPAVRDACTELGVQLAGVDLSNGTRLAINLGYPEAGGFACVEHDSALELRMSVEAHCVVSGKPDSVRGAVLDYLRAGVRSLDVLLGPAPGEVVDAEQPAALVAEVENGPLCSAVTHDTAEDFARWTEEARADLNAPKSAPPAGIEVNLNDTITVRLTDRGREILAARIESEQRAIPEYLRGINPPANRRPDADGYLSTTIWDFANVFGCFLSMGAREPVAMTATIKPAEPSREQALAELQAELEHARMMQRGAEDEAKVLREERDAIAAEQAELADAIRSALGFEFTDRADLLAKIKAGGVGLWAQVDKLQDRNEVQAACLRKLLVMLGKPPGGIDAIIGCGAPRRRRPCGTC